MPPLIQRYLRGRTTTDAEVNKVNEIVDEWRIRVDKLVGLLHRAGKRVEIRVQ